MGDIQSTCRRTSFPRHVYVPVFTRIWILICRIVWILFPYTLGTWVGGLHTWQELFWFWCVSLAHAFSTALAYLYCSHLAYITALKLVIEYFRQHLDLVVAGVLFVIILHEMLWNYVFTTLRWTEKVWSGDVQVSSDVPEGKGVSSSAALEVATMSAIAAAYGKLFAGPHWHKT